MADDHRTALRNADGRGVEAAARGQQALLETVATLEQRRRELVARCATAFAPLVTKKPASITLTDLAGCTAPDTRPLLIERAGTLRERIRAYHQTNSTLIAATRSLMDHAEGLLRQVSRQLSHAGTYSRRGVVEAVPGVVTALDIRS